MIQYKIVIVVGRCVLSGDWQIIALIMAGLGFLLLNVFEKYGLNTFVLVFIHVYALIPYSLHTTDFLWMGSKNPSRFLPKTTRFKVVARSGRAKPAIGKHIKHSVDLRVGGKGRPALAIDGCRLVKERRPRRDKFIAEADLGGREGRVCDEWRAAKHKLQLACVTRGNPAVCTENL